MSMSQFKYRPEIDGLRAVAVLSVLFYHAGFGFEGGYVGVDVFFVVSGYLITSLLLKEIEARTFSLIRFWERRIRRLFPALAVVLAGMILLGWLVLLPADFAEFGRELVAQSLIASNFYFWSSSGYFGGAAELKSLLHTWSLAVEEQFYLGFPLLLLVLRRCSRSTLFRVLAILGAASLTLSIYGSYRYPEGTFYLLPTRAWELAMGSLLAIRRPAVSSRVAREVICWLGLIMILFAAVGYSSETRFPGAAALVPCIGTGLLVWVGSTNVTAGRALSLRPVVYVGLISYSLYLWHWPLLVVLKHSLIDEPSQMARLAALAMSFVLAVLSLRFVETPFRKQQLLATRRKILSAAGLVFILFLGLGLAIDQRQGFPGRFRPEVVQLATPRKPNILNSISADDVRNGHVPVLGESMSGKGEPNLLLWGDSHAMMLGEIVDALALESGARAFATTKVATTPILGTWRATRGKAAVAFGTSRPTWGEAAVAFNDAVLSFIRDKRIRHVLLVSRWALYVHGRPDGGLDTLIVDERSTGASRDDARRVFRDNLKRTVNELRRLDVTVWLLRQVPGQRYEMARVLARAAILGVDRGGLAVTIAEHQEYQRFVDSVLNEVAGDGVHVLDPLPSLTASGGRTLVELDGNCLYRDDHHLSVKGAMHIRPVLEPLFRTMREDD